MNYWFEIYLLPQEVIVDDWLRLHKALQTYVGPFCRFKIVVSMHGGIIRFFIATNRDIAVLSNNLQTMLLRPVSSEEISIPQMQGTERGIQFVPGGNILDLKEKFAIKKSKDLQIAVFSLRSLGRGKVAGRADLYFVDDSGSTTKTSKLLTALPANILAISFDYNARYLKRAAPLYLNIEKTLHTLSSESTGAIFKVDTFPYFSRDYYLGLAGYDFDKHSLIVGASGSGKSKLISLLVDRLYNTALRLNYRVIVIDPHAAIAEDFSHIAQKRIVTFGAQDGANLFPGVGTDMTAATELTAVLFKSILADQSNARLDRLLRYSLLTLMTAQTMSLQNLKRLLTDVQYRVQITEHVRGYVPANLTKFFGSDFNEIYTQHYDSAILPIVAMVDEMQLQPSLVGENETSLAKVVQENFLTVFSLDRVGMGEKTVKTIAGLLIQQVFLLAQARIFGQKIILVIDEVSAVQNPAIAQILAEARKFNLTVVLTQQYLGQVEKILRDAIFANVYNYYTFKVSEEDARILEGNISIQLPKEVLDAEAKKGLSPGDVRMRVMTELHPRECIVRVLANGQVLPAIKARTVDTAVAFHAVLNPAKKTASAGRKLPAKFAERPATQRRETAAYVLVQGLVQVDPIDGGTLKPIVGLRDVLSAQASSSTIIKNEDS